MILIVVRIWNLEYVQLMSRVHEYVQYVLYVVSPLNTGTEFKEESSHTIFRFACLSDYESDTW